MPSLSPGGTSPSSFAQLLPGAPSESLQSLTTYTFRWKRYIAYISGQQLNILRSPTELVQAVTFGELLVAVKAEDGENGKIAVASLGHVWVLGPHTDSWNRVSWRKTLHLEQEDAGDQTRSLCWGSEGEILVGGTKQLSLFSTLPSSRNGTPASTPLDKSYVEERHALWSKGVSSPIQHATLSPSASLIVSCATHDRLVKIWRRLSFEEGLFDHAYLPHPSLVTHVEWRKLDPPHIEEDDTNSQRGKTYGARYEDEPEILYTFCMDGLLRVWKTGGHHDLEILTLHSSIDLIRAIPHSPSLAVNGAGNQQKPARYAFLLPSGDVTASISAAIAKRQLGTVSHSIEHLKEISSNHPDIVVTLDGHGRMSAWGLQSIGHKRRPSTPSGASKQAYHIAHAEDIDLKFSDSSNARFETWFEGDTLHILVHSFDGTISWWRGGVEQFFSPSAVGSDRLQCVASWTGNMGAVSGMKSSDASSNTLMWSSDGSITRLVPAAAQGLHARDRFSTATTEADNDLVLDVAFFRSKLAVLCVTATKLSVWSIAGRMLTSAPHGLSQSQNLRLVSPERLAGTGEYYLLLSADAQYAQITVTQDGKASKVDISVGKSGYLPISNDESSAHRWIHSHVADHPRKHGWLRLIGVSKDGIVSRRDVPSTRLDEKATIAEPPLSFPSCISNPAILESTCDVAALTSCDRSELVIHDLKEGYLEHRQQLADQIKLLRLGISSGSGRNGRMLAVAYSDAVEVLAQSHYEPSTSTGKHTWEQLIRISLSGLGLEINSVAWLPSGCFAVAAGNGLFVTGSGTEKNEEQSVPGDSQDVNSNAMSQVSKLDRASSRPLAIWHPHFLQQLSLHGSFSATIGIFKRLERKLRFFSEGDDLHRTLDLDPHEVLSDRSLGGGARLDQDTVNSLTSQFADLRLPSTSEKEQARLEFVLEAVSFIQEHLESLDVNALRYLFSWKLHVIHLDRERIEGQVQEKLTNGDHAELKVVPAMSWREIMFAYHSATQQPLLDVLTNHYGKQLNWTAVRSLGIPAWIRTIHAAQSEGADLASLEQIFDSLAQTAYRAAYPPDPSRASLFFLALKKKATLLALWRVAVGNREQRSTMNFLKRDFSAEENKTAARKNAYALMGKRRFEYAAAFFLLADDAASAIRILAGQCEDPLLAIAVARVYCGDESSEFSRFMDERVLPEARRTGDRWLLVWANEVLGRRAQAAKVLVMPIFQLQDVDSEHLVRRWQQDDPLALHLYEHLRKSPAVEGRAKGAVSLGAEPYEYRAVLRSARILRRMGLWLHALELVANWRFARPIPPSHGTEVADGETMANGAPEEAQATSSILDNFATPTTEPSSVPAAEKPKSLLEDFEASKPTAAPKSMLDGFDSRPVDREKSEREAKAAELFAKLKAKKEAASKPGEDSKKAMKEPTQFKEPESSSILDSFGF